MSLPDDTPVQPSVKPVQPVAQPVARLRRPALTAKVLRGLWLALDNGPAVDILNGALGSDEYPVSARDMSDLRAANAWVTRMVRHYRATHQGKGP